MQKFEFERNIHMGCLRNVQKQRGTGSGPYTKSMGNGVLLLSSQVELSGYGARRRLAPIQVGPIGR